MKSKLLQKTNGNLHLEQPEIPDFWYFWFGLILIMFSSFKASAQYDCNLTVGGYYTSIQNGSFESGSAQGSGAVITNASGIDSWHTTSSDNMMEVWQNGHYNLPSYNGDYYIEINATEMAAVYQDVATTPGDVMVYSFAHRGRDGVDQVQLLIGSNNGTLVSHGVFNTGNDLWVIYSGTYVVPAGQNITRFQIKATATSSLTEENGNLLDAVVFQSQIATCENPLAVNSEVCNNTRDDDNDGYTDCEDPDCENYYDCFDYYECNLLLNGNYTSLQNSTFDEYIGTIPDNGFSMIHQDDLEGWKTTASNGLIQVWDSDPNMVFSYEGKTHIELMGNEASVLYQDMATKPGDTLHYAFAHRGINGTDELKILMGSADNPNSMTSIDTASTGNFIWILYEGEYIVPDGQTITRVQFEAISSTGDNIYDGNYLDAIQVYSKQSSCTVLIRNEVYNNFIDDDGDGLFDCDDPDCHYILNCSEPLNCSSNAYLFQNEPTDIYEVNLSTGEITEIAPDITAAGTHISGAGYNSNDNYLWGFLSGSPSTVVRINSLFEVESFVIADMPGNNFKAGDVSNSGILFLYDTGVLALIDVNPFSDRYLTYLGTVAQDLGAITDFAINPIDDFIYAVRKGTNHLIKVNPINGAVTNFGEVPSAAGNDANYGSHYFANDGSLYFSSDDSGDIYKVETTHLITNANDISSCLFSVGAPTEFNNGAFCTSAVIAQEICNNGIDDDGDGLVDCDDPACLENLSCQEIPGNGIDDDGDGLIDCEDPDISSSSGVFSAVDASFYDPDEGDKAGTGIEIPFDEAGDNWGVAWGDYDGDGDPDVFFTSKDKEEPNLLFKNEGDGSFSKVTSGNIVTDMASSVASSWGDYDNDGDLDLYVANNIGFKNFLYRNNGDFTFTRIMNDPVVNFDGYSHGTSWADYNNDGYLDLLVADFFSLQFNRLFKNNGDGTFSEDTTSPISTDASYSVCGIWGDYDNDGDQDLFIANHNDQNNDLWRNEGNGDFTRMVGMDPCTDGGKSTGASWGDYDNDMDLDLIVTNAGDQDNFLYINQNGVLVRDSTVLIGDNAGTSHGSVWGDFNSDGHLDLYITNDNDINNFLYTGSATGDFTKEFENEASTQFGNSFGVAAADYDDDGHLDLVIANHSGQPNFLFDNAGCGCGHVSACIVLEGTNSPRDGVGSRIKVKANIEGQDVWQMREVSSQSGGGLSGQSDYRQHFGLGDAKVLDSIIVEWSSGYTQILTNQLISGCLRIVEDNSSEVCGKVFFDENANCVIDGDEPGIPNVNLTVQPGNMVVTSDAEGNYSFNAEPGEYTISQNLVGTNWDTTCTTVQQVTVVGLGDILCGNHFSNASNCDYPDLEVELSATAHRVGFENLIAITYRNNGTHTATGVNLTVDLDPNVIPIQSSIPWDSYSSNTLVWNLEDMTIGTAVTIYVVDSISTNAVIGENINITSTIDSVEDDCDESDNTHVNSALATGAIDPNDILVNPEGYIDNDQELVYKIRFQNVGNAMVSRVIIEDQLPESLDISTLQLGVASHPYRFEVNNNRLVWTFENINMPDSTTNEPESHGFVLFKIKPMEGLADQSVIENQASIFFDFQDPIITNTVVNIIGRAPGAVDETGGLHIFPNPMDDATTIQIVPLNPGQVNIQALFVYDLLGKELLSHFGSASKEYRLSKGQLKTGYYFVKAIGEDGKQYVGKVVVR